MALSIGQTPPDFNLPNHQGEAVSLSGLLANGGPVVVFFYPKNGTPGCTQQMCTFGQQYSVFQQHNVTIVGISGDSQSSHTSTTQHHSLPFNLLSDPKHTTRQAWGLPTFLGLFPHRVTVVLDNTGRVYHLTKSMFNISGHITGALSAVRQLAGATDTHD